MNAPRGELVFHRRVPLAPGADRLLPLSDLAKSAPEVYANAIAKYDETPERRLLRDASIPHIDRTWIEVVFFTPIHPHAIWATWRELSGNDLPAIEYWAVPATLLPDPAVLLERRLSPAGGAIHPDDVAWFDRDTFRTATETTPASREWLADLAERGASGAWFNRTPHVLVGAPVALDGAHVVGWEQHTSWCDCAN